METKEEQKMRKRNMKLFPSYKALAWDFLFYYAIDFLFLTQIKGMSSADVVLLTSIQALFGIFLQIPSNIIVDLLGRRKSIILGNVLNCIYLIIFIFGQSLVIFGFAKLISALAKTIKNIAEPTLLNESIPPSTNKGNIYGKIVGKGATGHFILNAISKIVAGYTFTINGYMPLILSLIVCVIVTIMSVCYIEPVEKREKTKGSLIIKQYKNDVIEGVRFIFKSRRLRALMISSALIGSLLTILVNYQTSLLKDINLSATVIGIVAAIMSVVNAYASKKQTDFHNRFHNKTIIIIAFMASISTIIAGILGMSANQFGLAIVIIILMFIIENFSHGIYYTIRDRYFRNFTNEKIDTKIFAVRNLTLCITSGLFGMLASFLLTKMNTALSMIVVGSIFTMLFVLMGIYMKPRIGLKPEEYSEEERKYDELVM